MRTSVVLTVDVEASIAGGIDHYAQGFRPVIDQWVAGNVGGRSEGLGFIIRTLQERGLHGTFFVEAAQAHYFGAAAMGRYVEQLQHAGQDVQLHVHPCWFCFHDGAPDLTRLVGDSCATIAEPLLEAFFRDCMATYRGWTGHDPVALRTGSFSTGSAVYRVMQRLGIPLSSNLAVALYQPVEPEYRLTGGSALIAGIREYPCTCFQDRRGIGRTRLRPLQVTSCSLRELIAIIERAWACGYDTVVVLTHPFEYFKVPNRKARKAWNFEVLTPNRTVQGRLRGLCDHLLEHQDRFEVCTFADLARRPPQVQISPQPLGNSPLQSWARTLENVLSDRLKWL